MNQRLLRGFFIGSALTVSAVALLFFGNIHQAFAAAPLRIFYFVDSPTARASLFAHPTAMDVLAPQSYEFDTNAVLQGSVDPSILAFAKANNIKVMPLVTNGSFDQASLTAVLNDPTRENAAIAMLVAEAKKEGYWGWQIDFEQMNASYKDQYSEFVAKAAVALHANGLELSVAVIAQNSGNPSDYPANLWNNLIGAYDYSALASSTDFVSVMSYDDPTSTGPVAPLSWMKSVISYSLKFIPADKLSLGLPLYYWKWDSTTGKLVDVGGWSGIHNSFAVRGVIAGFDPTQSASFLNYSVGGSIYTIWYEDAQSIQAKLALVTDYQLQGFSAWALGLESPDIYTVQGI
jgi:spore germination protein YaaH